METYTLRRIQSMLGISRAVISGLMDSGFVTPSRIMSIVIRSSTDTLK